MEVLSADDCLLYLKFLKLARWNVGRLIKWQLSREDLCSQGWQKVEGSWVALRWIRCKGDVVLNKVLWNVARKGLLMNWNVTRWRAAAVLFLCCLSWEMLQGQAL